MLPIIKVFDVDYSFIIKNYLDPKLWEKEWTLFLYKKFTVSIKLHSIMVKEKAIIFEVKVIDDSSSSWNRSKTETLKYTLSVENIDILKKQINGVIKRLFLQIEVDLYIERTDAWDELCSMQYEERKGLYKIAKDFLDNNNIENENIRSAYADAYVDENEKAWDMKRSYKDAQEYTMIPDLFLVFAESTKDEYLKNTVLNKNEDRAEELMKELKELKEYMETDEYEEEMQGKLEEI